MFFATVPFTAAEVKSLRGQTGQMDRNVHRASVPDLRSLQWEPQAFALSLPQARDLSSLCRSPSLFLPCLLPLPALLGASDSSELWLSPAHRGLSTFPTPSSSGHFSLSTHCLTYSPTEPVPKPLSSLLLVKRHVLTNQLKANSFPRSSSVLGKLWGISRL